jgi:hypothetical protein
MSTLERPIIDYLPAVVRGDEPPEGSSLGAFLSAFEAVFEGIDTEIDRVAELYGLAPTPRITGEIMPGETVLPLDHAAGICPGDVLELVGTVRGHLDYVEVAEVRVPPAPASPAAGGGPLETAPRLVPTEVVLRAGPRFEHDRGGVVHVLGREAGSAKLALPVDAIAVAGSTAVELQLSEPVMPVPMGGVVRIGEGPDAEYGRVLAAEPGRLTVVPPTLRSHPARSPVVAIERASTTTPPAAPFPWAVRGGPELVLAAPAVARRSWIQLDTYAGLRDGDILHVRDPDPGRIEFLRVRELPPRRRFKPGGGVRRSALELRSALRFDHDAGVGVGVMGARGAATVLAERTHRGDDSVSVKDAELLALRPGDVMAVGSPRRRGLEHVQVIDVSANRIRFAPALLLGHPAERQVARIAPVGSGTGFLRWLAGWIGLELRADRGERWNRELLRSAGRVWPYRGTGGGLDEFLRVYLAGDATARTFAPANPMQVGFISTVGVDTTICGASPDFFQVDVESGLQNPWHYSPGGLTAVLQAAAEALRRERPAHTYYDLHLNAHTMQVGVDELTEIGARVGETTLLWSGALVVEGDR